MFTFFIWPFYIYAHGVVFITVTSAAAEILHIKHIRCQLDDYSYIFFTQTVAEHIDSSWLDRHCIRGTIIWNKYREHEPFFHTKLQKRASDSAVLSTDDFDFQDFPMWDK